MSDRCSIAFKILKFDLLRKKTISVLLFFFILTASFLVASSAHMIVELMSSLNYLFAKSNVPHFVQMHTGRVHTADIESWGSQNTLVKKTQIVEMLQLESAKVFISPKGDSESNSIMNLDFVTQNQSFDFLYNLNGEVIHPSSGEVAVPVYYKQRYQLNVGDKIKILTHDGKRELVIVDFIRDALMNPSIIHSKRLLISPDDYEILKDTGAQRVYLLEFQLTDLSHLNAFSSQYESSSLPQNGPSVPYQLYKIINAVTDGFTIGLITLMSILLTLVAILSLRFTILITMEEDYQQVGIMKAIGVQQGYIKRLYLLKYIVIGAFASLMGYFLSLCYKKVFIANILLYLGAAPKSDLLQFIPLLSVFIIFFVIVISCLLLLRKLTAISAIEALRVGIAEQLKKPGMYLSLMKSRYLNLNIFLGLKGVLERWRQFILLFFVFTICAFAIVLPVNFFNTIQSPAFMTFIGIGKSEMRIDRQHDSVDAFKKMLAYIKNDKAVDEYAAVIASRFKVLDSVSPTESIRVESGDSSVFPIYYLKGRAPSNTREIALSYLNSKALNKETGDHIRLLLKDKPVDILVTGVYQDVTNGGKTAKAIFPYDPNTVLWYVFNVNFKSNTALDGKIKTYAKQFPQARVTHVNDYLMQTLGDLINQIKILAIMIVCVIVFIAVMMSSLFMKLLLARHSTQIAIMKALGFSLSHIKVQYLTRALFVLNAGFISGVILCNTFGEWLTGLVWSLMGAPEIKFIINPLYSYILCPLLLMCVVSVTTIASASLIKHTHIARNKCGVA